VDAGDDQPVVTFSPHSLPVTGLRVLPSAPHQLLSCSQDGAVRCLNLTGGAASAAFVELYRAPEDALGDYASLHRLSRTVGEGGALAIARGDGVVVLMDTRVSEFGICI
jgi:WD40 repeat protein